MLKSLEMYGFKSFADRTRFDFAAGLTGVVGPNGSGKSNVVDALKWILGDQSAKSLRGSEMTDVIFNGSASRKPCTYAEAFLTIDNTSGILAVEAAEVTIGRRIYRTGDAEYLINRAPARLKDVRDLLLGTGAGNAAYCIIEQGRVDQILQANPTSRRIVFEEAAGISRFKARRVEAQRKLERVGQNLQRLADIVDEVEAQLNALRGQAAKAVKFREVQQELTEWWQGLAADDYRAATAELQLLADRLATATTQLESLNEAQKTAEEAEARFEKSLAEIDLRLREADRRLATHREQGARQEASVRFQTTRLTELEAERSQLREQQLLLERRVQDALTALAAERDALATAGDEAARLHERLFAQDQQLAGLRAASERTRAAVEEARGQRLDAVKRLSAAEQSAAAVDLQASAIAESRQRLGQLWEELQNRLTANEARRAELRQTYDAAHQEWEQAQARLRHGTQRVQELAATVQRARDQLAQQREARSAALARRSLLEDLELRQEGMSLGAKELLHRARTTNTSPWNTIVGSVSDLLDVDLEHAGVIEVALGQRAQWIVLREYQPLLDYLAGGPALLSGRLNFFAVADRSQSQPIPPMLAGDRLVHLQALQSTPRGLHHEPGVVARADELILSEHGVTGLAAGLLSDTWVVETLDVALRLSLGPGRGARFVTRQGELLDESGSIQLGPIRSETSVLSRKSELRRLKNDLIRMDRDLAQQELILQDAQQKLLSDEAESAAAAAIVEQRSQWAAEALQAWRAADHEAEHDRREAERVAGQLQAAEEEGQRIERSRQEADQRLMEARDRVTAVEAALAQVELAATEALTQVQQLEQSKSAEQLDLVKQAERAATQRAAIERLEEDVLQRQSQLTEGRKRLAISDEQQQQLTLELLQSRAELAEHYAQADHALQEVTQIQGEKHELRQQRAAFADQELQLRRQRRDWQDQRHACEIRQREVQQQLATLAERIHEDYQLSLEELAATGVSAWQLALDARHHDRSGDDDSGADEHAGQSHARHRRTTDSHAAGESSTVTADPSFAELRPELEARVARLRRKLKLIGHVNTDSLNDLEQLERRFEHLSHQLQDLVEAKATLEDIIRRINQESKRLFAETFATIRKHFQQLFRKVFGGGEGDVVLEDPEDILDCGIEITARPPGKELRSLSLLSGGEKTMTAIALIMAIFQAKPSPFCILDEVDAALDEANVDRFAGVLREFQSTTQFIMITHHKRSMMVADVLYGVTMEESGVSKRMSVRFEEISDNGEIRTSSSASAA